MYLESYFLKFKHNDNLDWFLIGCIISIAWALTSVVYIPYFVENSLNDETIGSILTLRGIMVLIFSFFIIQLLEKFNHVNLIFYTSFPLALIYFIFSFSENIILIILLFFVVKILAVLRTQAREIEFRNSASEVDFIQLRGLFQAIQNFFWITTPILGGFLLEYYGSSFVFIVISVLVLISGLFVKFFKIKSHQRHLKKINKNFIKNLKYYFSKRQLIYSFLMNFSLASWYVLIFLYVPLYILINEYSKLYIGIALAATQIPLPFIQFKIKYFIKKIGIKKLFKCIYFCLIIILIIMFFNTNIYIFLLLLFLSGILLGFLEILPTLYYFKQVNTNNEDRTFPIFSDGNFLASIIINLLFTIILLFLPISYLFLVLAIIFVGFFIMTFYIKDYTN